MPQRSMLNSDVSQAKTNGAGSHLSSAVMQGLRSECSAVWFNCGVFEVAESHYYIRLQERQNGTMAAPSTSACQLNHNASLTKATVDQGENNIKTKSSKRASRKKRSPSKTSASPVSRPANGLPFVPAALQGVWLQKPIYDQAEAAFYQNLYRQNEPHSAPSKEQAGKHPSNNNITNKAKSDRTKEKVPRNGGIKKEGGTQCHFLHAGSERVWLERTSYAEAETRFYEGIVAKTSQTALIGCSPSLKMSGVDCWTQERIWFDKPRYDEAERKFYERMNGPTPATQKDSGSNSILQDIARARENIQKSLAGTTGGSNADHGEILTRMKNLELENQSLHKVVEDLRSALSKLESRVSVLEKRPAAPAAVVNGTASNKATPPPQKTPAAPSKNDDDDDDDDDDDIDLFGSDDEVDEEAERIKEQRLQEYAAKKAKKPALIAKSSILLDVKPWDDETDMAKLEECVRSVQVDGLLWGASKLVPVGYGIKKLQINCVVEDDKVGTDLLEEEITKFEDYVQSVDVAAFNKI
ncbi:eukaryotic translation elongation factor 1 delta b (guanine nucleotide exchange protein) isoform X2 [Trichomycterus rosablanca]|uniref:eukaryotic translation elongation factor 1 delta b (guanine nucleotide exchange protein) isoform X2 n=1 Tax=Trichomycterus rosablanca TaxID=2290929 RepID=UPI002F3588C3